MAPSAFQCAFDVYSLEPTLNSAVTALENVREAVAPAHDEKDKDEANFHCPGVTNRHATVAGSGTAGFSGDGGPAIVAQLKQPDGLAVDSAGNLYISDSPNHRVRKVSGGVITTLAGTGVPGFTIGEGPAAKMQINFPVGLCVDSTGNLYIADYGNNLVRKVTPAGVMSTLAGLTPDTMLNRPSGVAVDSAGNLYIADQSNSLIRKVSAGKMSIIAGVGAAGFSGDGGPAASARLNFARDLVFDPVGNL